MADTCNSRSLSWIVKQCRPDPRRDVRQRSPELRPSPTPSAAAILSLPDDLLLDCLSRLPSTSLPAAAAACRRFSSLLDSPEFARRRRLHGRLRRCLHAVAVSDLGFLLSASLPIDADDGVSWSPPTAAAIPLETLDSSSFSFAHARAAAAGRVVYVVGRGATLRLDTWTGAVATLAPTLFPRKKFAAAAVDGKIYVAGGASRTSAVEEYDPIADEWRVVAEAPTRRYGCVGAAAAGVFYIAGGLKVAGSGSSGARLDAHVCAGSMDAYHVGASNWLRGRSVAMSVPGGGCVVGACGAAAKVYVIASHAVELSFWRWDGKGRRGGDWARLEPPPVPARMGLGGALRFSCVAVGEERVVAVVNLSGGDGGRRGVDGAIGMEGAVLVYNVGDGKWSRGPDLPTGFRRATIACIEC